MSTLTLTLADFQAALPFSTKIEDAQLRPFIDLSQQLDLVPLLGWPVLEAVGALAMLELLPYVPGAVVGEGKYVVRQERVYLALLTTDAPPPVAAFWQYQPLRTLWSQYLKPYWLRASFARFSAEHGLNFTKAGITVPTDREGTFTQPSAAARAALQASQDSTAEALRSRLTAFMASEARAYAADNTLGYAYPVSSTCAAPTTARRAPLRGINSSRRPR